MKEIPLLFSSPMVLATLADLKTKTRRTSKLDIINKSPDDWEFLSFADGKYHFKNKLTNRLFSVKCPYGQVGDRLWVRETWQMHPSWNAFSPSRITNHNCVYYTATDGIIEESKVRPSIHLPRWASRLTLEVVSIKVERLNDITEADAMAEGVGTEGEEGFATHWKAFSTLWDSINGEGSWDANPWVWVVEFKRLEVQP